MLVIIVRLHIEPTVEDPMINTSPDKQYGAIDPDQRAKLTGLEFVQGFVDGSLPQNTMARTLNYDIVEVTTGRVVVTSTPSAEFLNPEGTVHGGVAATLLDTCMGLAVRSTLGKGLGSVALEFKISFVRPITVDSGLVRAIGSVLNCGRRVATAEGRLVDGADRLLAHGTTTCIVFER
jgi:uncharacterized protein (TIGR00369 family)